MPFQCRVVLDDEIIAVVEEHFVKIGQSAERLIKRMEGGWIFDTVENHELLRAIWKGHKARAAKAPKATKGATTEESNERTPEEDADDLAGNGNQRAKKRRAPGFVVINSPLRNDTGEGRYCWREGNGDDPRPHIYLWGAGDDAKDRDPDFLAHRWVQAQLKNLGQETGERTDIEVEIPGEDDARKQFIDVAWFGSRIAWEVDFSLQERVAQEGRRECRKNAGYEMIALVDAAESKTSILNVATVLLAGLKDRAYEAVKRPDSRKTLPDLQSIARPGPRVVVSRVEYMKVVNLVVLDLSWRAPRWKETPGLEFFAFCGQKKRGEWVYEALPKFPGGEPSNSYSWASPEDIEGFKTRCNDLAEERRVADEVEQERLAEARRLAAERAREERVEAKAAVDSAVETTHERRSELAAAQRQLQGLVQVHAEAARVGEIKSVADRIRWRPSRGLRLRANASMYTTGLVEALDALESLLGAHSAKGSAAKFWATWFGGFDETVLAAHATITHEAGSAVAQARKEVSTRQAALLASEGDEFAKREVLTKKASHHPAQTPNPRSPPRAWEGS